MLGHFPIAGDAIASNGAESGAPAPSGAITSQPAPNGQTQRFVGTTTSATSGSYTLTGSNGGVTVGPTAFTVVDGAFDFTVSGLTAGTYTPTLTVIGPGGTAGVTGTSAFSINGAGGGPGFPEGTRTIRAVLIKARNDHSPADDATGLKWAIFAGTPDAFGAPVAQGAAGVLSRGVFTASAVINPAVYWLTATNSDGNPANPWRVFSGPVTVT